MGAFFCFKCGGCGGCGGCFDISALVEKNVLLNVSTWLFNLMLFSVYMVMWFYPPHPPHPPQAPCEQSALKVPVLKRTPETTNIHPRNLTK